MNLDLIEQLLSKTKEFDWCTGQQIYPVLLKKQIERHDLSFFDPSKYQDWHGFKDGQTARHYYLSWGEETLDIYFSDWKKVVRELSNASNADPV